VHCIPVWRHRSQVSASFCPRDGRTHLNAQSLLPVGSPRTKKAAHRIRTFRHCSHAVVYILMHRMDIKVMNSSMDSRVCLDPEKTRGSGVQIWTATKNIDAYICSSLHVKRLQSYLSGRRNESAQPRILMQKFYGTLVILNVADSSDRFVYFPSALAQEGKVSTHNIQPTSRCLRVDAELSRLALTVSLLDPVESSPVGRKRRREFEEPPIPQSRIDFRLPHGRSIRG